MSAVNNNPHEIPLEVLTATHKTQPNAREVREEKVTQAVANIYAGSLCSLVLSGSSVLAYSIGNPPLAACFGVVGALGVAGTIGYSCYKKHTGQLNPENAEIDPLTRQIDENNL